MKSRRPRTCTLCVRLLCSRAASAGCVHGVRSVLIAAAIGVVSGCGGATPSPATAAGATPSATAVVNPCSLLADAEVQTALGEPVSAGTKGQGTIVGCVWTGTNAANVAASDADVVILNMSDPGNFATAEKSSSSTFEVDKVNGVGDDAFYQRTGTLSLLEVRTGSTVFTVDVEKNNQSDRTAEKQLALRILSTIAAHG